MKLSQTIDKKKNSHPTYTEMHMWARHAEDLEDTLEKCKEYLRELGYDYDKRQTRLFNKTLDELEDR